MRQFFIKLSPIILTRVFFKKVFFLFTIGFLFKVFLFNVDYFTIISSLFCFIEILYNTFDMKIPLDSSIHNNSITRIKDIKSVTTLEIYQDNNTLGIYSDNNTETNWNSLSQRINNRATDRANMQTFLQFYHNLVKATPIEIEQFNVKITKGFNEGLSKNQIINEWPPKVRDTYKLYCSRYKIR
jgi:hypothetical protein